MSTALRRFTTGSARQLVLWCLLVALPVYGLSGTITQWLGHQHFHRATAAAPADVMADWQFFGRIGHGPTPHAARRARAMAEAGTGTGTTGTESDSSDGAGAIARPSEAGFAGTGAVDRAASHSHAGLARHHHPGGDPDVVVIDGAGRDDGLNHAGNSAGSGLAAQMFVLPAGATLPALGHAHGVWAAVDPHLLGSHDPRRLERPPKG